MKTLKAILLVSCLSLLSCNKNDDPVNCPENDSSVTVNGEKQSFYNLGYGIDLEENGHRLHLNIERSNPDPYREQSFIIFLRFKKTGKNIIEKIIYHQYINGVVFDSEVNQSQIQSKVTINRSTCFKGSFSATFHDGDKQVEVKDADINFQYNEPMN